MIPLLFSMWCGLVRPTKPLAWWDGGDHISILGGRDGLAGGTWLACTRDGRVAFLTNVRELQSLSQPKSRGHLPVRFLQVDLFFTLWQFRTPCVFSIARVSLLSHTPCGCSIAQVSWNKQEILLWSFIRIISPVEEYVIWSSFKNITEYYLKSHRTRHGNKNHGDRTSDLDISML